MSSHTSTVLGTKESLMDRNHSTMRGDRPEPAVIKMSFMRPKVRTLVCKGCGIFVTLTLQ